MKNLTRSISLAIAFAVASSVSASEVPRGCVGVGTKQEMCLLNFGDLWSGREQYSGRTITLNGYLVMGFGRLMLYPGKDYFFYQQGSGGIALHVTREVFDGAIARMAKPIRQPDWDYEVVCPVHVIGNYDDAPLGDLATLGQIEVSAEGLLFRPVDPVDGHCGFVSPVRP